MSDEKKIEKLIGDAMKDYRVTPRANAREAIEKQLIEKNLLKRGVAKGNFLSRFGLIVFFAALIPAIYFLNKNFNNGQDANSMVAATDTAKASFINSENKTISGEHKIVNENEQKKNIESENKNLAAENFKDNKTNNEKLVSEKVSGAEKKNVVAESGIKASATRTSIDTERKNHASNFSNTEKEKQPNKLPDESRNEKKHSEKKNNPEKISDEPTFASAMADKGKPNPVTENQNEANNNLPADNATIQNHAEENKDDNKTPEQITSENKNAATETPTSNSSLAEKNEAEKVPDAIAETKPAQENIAPENIAVLKTSLPEDSATRAKAAAILHPVLSLDLFGATDFNSEKYGSADAATQSYLNEAKQSEKIISSFGGGLGINVHLNKFIFQTGITSSVLRSKFSFSEIKSSLDSSGYYDYIDSTYIDSSGVHVIHVDSTFIGVTDTVISKTPFSATNKVSFIEIPLLAGYQFSSGKFDFEIKAGASIAFLTNVNTTMISLQSGEMVKYTGKTDSPYRNSHWNFLASLSVLYNINKKLSFFVQPSVKYGLGSIYKSEYPVSKKIQSYSIGAGLRIKF